MVTHPAPTINADTGVALIPQPTDSPDELSIEATSAHLYSSPGSPSPSHPERKSSNDCTKPLNMASPSSSYIDVRAAAASPARTPMISTLAAAMELAE